MSKKKVGIIDYGAGNSGSIYNALNYLEYEPKFIQNPEEAKDYSHLILPGVGHFGKLANNLINNNWKTKLNHLVSRGHMLFGICVGMQLLFEKSAEAQGVKGLGILKGSLLNFQSLENKFKLPIPHIGFNNVLHDPMRYPSVTIDEIKALRPNVIFLSSEPYPFEDKHLSEFDKLDITTCVVDGEMFSWYGTRMLKSWEYFKKLSEKLK